MPEPLYVAARRTLLDALEALHDHRHAVVLVGAQAVYVHTGDADLAVAAYTTDSDLAINPADLLDEPLLEELLTQAHFERAPTAVGQWAKSVDVEGVPRQIIVDLLVPESLGGGGRRAARIPPHGNRVARKVRGLEGALVDKEVHTIGALDKGEERTFDLTVAGPSALLVAKLFKIVEREMSPDRQSDKDALDVLRLLRSVQTDELARRIVSLQGHELSRAVTAAAVEDIERLFGSAGAPGCSMAARAAYPLEARETIAASAVALASDLTARLRRHTSL